MDSTVNTIVAIAEEVQTAMRTSGTSAAIIGGSVGGFVAAYSYNNLSTENELGGSLGGTIGGALGGFIVNGLPGAINGGASGAILSYNGGDLMTRLNSRLLGGTTAGICGAFGGCIGPYLPPKVALAVGGSLTVFGMTYRLYRKSLK